MGWVGIAAAEKRAEFKTTLYAAAKTNPLFRRRYNFLCVDLFAFFRKVVPPTMGTDVTPRDAVSIFLWPSLFALMPELVVAVICSDDSSRVPS